MAIRTKFKLNLQFILFEIKRTDSYSNELTRVIITSTHLLGHER